MDGKRMNAMAAEGPKAMQNRLIDLRAESPKMSKGVRAALSMTKAALRRATSNQSEPAPVEKPAPSVSHRPITSPTTSPAGTYSRGDSYGRGSSGSTYGSSKLGHTTETPLRSRNDADSFPLPDPRIKPEGPRNPAQAFENATYAYFMTQGEGGQRAFSITQLRRGQFRVAKKTPVFSWKSLESCRIRQFLNCDFWL